ncbi:YjgN family protein [Ideonella sp.]|uniref:YjgN family protein n=1 Tax=Ideonella sp. TaxID=1929293 RepID=UPI0035B43278
MHDIDTPLTRPAAAWPETVPPPPPLPSAGPTRLPVVFTGSGSEYFRIWVVNLLLTIVTLSLYRPFAKARRLAYFHGNTLVGGQPLGFHGNPWKMLRGYLLMLLFGGVYVGASQLSPVAAVAALVAFVALWPALWRASLQFRLANTSWRGVRMAFTGDLAGAYRAMLPGALPWLLFVGSTLFLPTEAPADAEPAMPDALPWVFGIAMAAMLALMPLSLAWIKRYQHGHYAYAGERCHLEARTGRFYVLALKVLGVSLAGVVVPGLVVAAGFAWSDGPGAASLLVLIASMSFYGVFFLVTLPYAQSRLQNLVWGATCSRSLRFHSALPVLPLGWLGLKNLALVILTLGLYWPFAAVAVARLRLQAVSVQAEGDIDQWQAGAVAGQHDATGDAAGDFFGIDMGL